MAFWYRVVSPSEAHVVVTPTKKIVVSSDERISNVKNYYAIPKWLPMMGRIVRVIDLTIKEIVIEQETYEKSQARYLVKSSMKYRVKNVLIAAETFTNEEDLQSQLIEVVSSSVRAVTVRYDVVEARALKQKMEQEIRNEMTDDLAAWGLELVNFQLVDFKDTPDSKIISNISKRQEVEIESITREMNAEKLKLARIKEAEAEEIAQTREITRDKVIQEEEQKKIQAITEQQKITKEREYEIIQIQTIKQAQINKEQAKIIAQQEMEVAEIEKQKTLVIASQNKEVASVERERLRLEGEGQRLKAEEIAKGEAAPILERLLAEAKGKKELQDALDKYGDNAIRALVAEKLVQMQKEVGVAIAEALKTADVRLFAGGDSCKEAFDIGSIISSAQVSNEQLVESVLNRIARPNDLGFTVIEQKEKLKNEK